MPDLTGVVRCQHRLCVRRSRLQVQALGRPLPRHAQEQGMAAEAGPGQAAGACRTCRLVRGCSSLRGCSAASGLYCIAGQSFWPRVGSPQAAKRTHRPLEQRCLLQGHPTGVASRGARASGASALDQASALSKAEPSLHAQHRCVYRNATPDYPLSLDPLRKCRHV